MKKPGGVAAARSRVKGRKAVGKDRNPANRLRKIVARLEKAYPDARCALKHDNAFQLLIATILSAQCTDVRVNMVTPGLFQKHSTPKDFAALRQEVLQADIRSTGFFRNKAKSIIGAAQRIVKEYRGRMPDTMEDLLTLPGVARKTANVVLGTAFGKATGVVVDTHVHRISHRLNLSRGKRPDKIEQDLMRQIPQDKWIFFAHAMIFHGRQRCTARRPECSTCSLEDLCDSGDKTV